MISGPEDVEYLFELGQTRLIVQARSERSGYSKLETHHVLRSEVIMNFGA